MKVYFYDELLKKSNDELLDLLSSYIFLRNDICNIITYDPDNKELYTENYVYFYILNITKIKNVLKSRTLIT